MAAEPIRILNLFTILNRGGAETMVMNYYRRIDRSRIQFDFMVHRQERGAYEEEIQALGGRIYRMPPVRPWNAREYRSLAGRFYGEHPEYRIIHAHMSELGFYDFQQAKKAGVPVRICHAHNRPYGIDLKSPVRWYYKTRMMPYVTDLFTCGREAGDWLFGRKQEARFVQMNNAIDARQYVFCPQTRQRMRQALGIGADQLVIGHVGRFDPQKNHKFIIDIFQAVRQQNSKAVLLLIGNDAGGCGKEIHQKAERLGLTQWVRFLGVRGDVADLMQTMDVFLFPSLFEGLSVASVEAQAAGLPVLISDGVPIECKKTDLVHVLPLSATPEVWAKTALELAQIPRRNTYEEIKAAGFDIAENAQWLQAFYLRAAQR